MFQFKINHHILYTCDKLLKAKITDSDSYHVCELKQTVEHLFEECQHVHFFSSSPVAIIKVACLSFWFCAFCLR